MFAVVTRDISTWSIPEDDYLTHSLEAAWKEARARWDRSTREEKRDRTVTIYDISEEDYRFASNPDNGVALGEYGRGIMTFAMFFEKVVIEHIGSSYDIPDEMAFYIDGEEYSFEEWVEEYVARLDYYADCPYSARSSERDVYEVGEEILEIMTVAATTGCARSPRFKDFTVGMGE